MPEKQIKLPSKTDYYSQELQPFVDNFKKSPCKIKVTNDNRSSKWLNLNIDSIETLKAFSEIIQEIIIEMEN